MAAEAEKIVTPSQLFKGYTTMVLRPQAEGGPVVELHRYEVVRVLPDGNYVVTMPGWRHLGEGA